MSTDEQDEAASIAISEAIKDIKPRETVGSLFISGLIGADFSPRECAAAVAEAVAFLALFSAENDGGKASVSDRVAAITMLAAARAETFLRVDKSGARH